jgi:hypothetical protein
VIARTPEALKLKAAMLRQEDYFDQIPSVGAADLLRSLLRDLAQWDG